MRALSTAAWAEHDEPQAIRIQSSVRRIRVCLRHGCCFDVGRDGAVGGEIYTRRQRSARRACAVQPLAASHAAAASVLLATAGSSSLNLIATERVTPSNRTR